MTNITSTFIQAAGNPGGSAKLPFSLALSHRRLETVLLAVVLRVSIDLMYAFCVSPVFGYGGFVLNINQTYLWVSYLAVIAVGLLTPQRRNRPSSDIVFIFYILAYVPASSLFALLPGSAEFFALYTIAMLILYSVVTLVPEFRAPKDVENGLAIYLGGALTCVALVFALMIARGGLSYFSFDLLSVYTRRDEILNTVTSGFVGYLAAWTAKVFVPSILVYGLWKGRKSVALLGVSLSLLFFAFTSHKAYIVNPVGVLVVYYACKCGAFRRGFLIAAIAGSLVGLLFFLAFDSRLVASYLSMRMYSIPSFMELQTYNFFQTHPFVYWSDTFMSSFYPNPYSEPVSYIIGRDMFGFGKESQANTGVFATGYMHCGAMGMFILAALTGLAFKVIDMMTVGRMPYFVGLSIAVIPAVQFLAADFTTVLVTHGVLMMCLTLYLIGERKRPREPAAEDAAERPSSPIAV